MRETLLGVVSKNYGNEDDVEYIRADLAAARVEQLEQALRKVQAKRGHDNHANEFDVECSYCIISAVLEQKEGDEYEPIKRG